MAAAVFAGLLPVMFDRSTKTKVMRRIATPMVGDTVRSLVLSMPVIATGYHGGNDYNSSACIGIFNPGAQRPVCVGGVP